MVKYGPRDAPSPHGTLGTLGPPGALMSSQGFSDIHVLEDFSDVGLWTTPRGRKLAEIYSMYIDGEHLSELHGKLVITEGYGTHNIHIFDHRSTLDRGDHEVELFGPNLSIGADDDFEIRLELWDDTTCLPPPEPFAPSLVEFHRFEIGNLYDEIQEATTTCRYGKVRVQYVVMQDAAEAEVEACFIDGRGVEVSGYIRVSTIFGHIHLLHRKERREAVLASRRERSVAVQASTRERREVSEEVSGITLSSGASIPMEMPQARILLPRNIIAVPFGTSFKIQVKLRNRHGYEIVKGSSEFSSPEVGKLHTARIGNIELRVKWL